MEIHVVQPGESLYSIALRYGIPMSLLADTNGLQNTVGLAPGQALLILIPRETHVVRPGETLYTIARAHGLTLRQILRNNPGLRGSVSLWPGQTLYLSYEGEPLGAIEVNAYAYPFVNQPLLRTELPYLTWLTPFTYGFFPDGSLLPLDDGKLISLSEQYGVGPLMHLSTLTEEGGFSSELAQALLQDPEAQRRLADAIEETMKQKGYLGLDVDFEYLPPESASSYAAFLRQLRDRLNPLGWPVIAALAPKTSAEQKGLLYEGHDYAAIGQAVNAVLLMTYEWGYVASEPMAVAPLPNVRRVLEYALTEMPPEQIYLGIPAYGYDWPLPYVRGETRARSLSCQEAVELAVRYGASIQFDGYSQSPWFRYTAEDGREHEVWFEDVRSIRGKLELVAEYGLRGVGYWNAMRPFPSNWPLLNAMFEIEEIGSPR